MMTNETLKLVLLWPRDAPKWNAGTPKQYRLNRVFEEMAVLGIEPEPALYAAYQSRILRYARSPPIRVPRQTIR